MNKGERRKTSLLNEPKQWKQRLKWWRHCKCNPYTPKRIFILNRAVNLVTKQCIFWLTYYSFYNNEKCLCKHSGKVCMYIWRSPFFPPCICVCVWVCVCVWGRSLSSKQNKITMAEMLVDNLPQKENKNGIHSSSYKYIPNSLKQRTKSNFKETKKKL